MAADLTFGRRGMRTGNREKSEFPPIQAAADSLGKRIRPSTAEEEAKDLRFQTGTCGVNAPAYSLTRTAPT